MKSSFHFDCFKMVLISLGVSRTSARPPCLMNPWKLSSRFDFNFLACMFCSDVVDDGLSMA